MNVHPAVPPPIIKNPNTLLPINSINVKLFLYVGVAVLTSLVSELYHHADSQGGGFNGINEVQYTIIFVNLILQALIAWRAFIDGSVYQYQEALDKEYIEEHKPKKNKKSLKTNSKRRS
jgi:hypothetical protein